MSVKDWSATAASNSSIDGISVAENCPFANMNNAVRSIMSNVKLEVADVGAAVASAATPDLSIDGQVHTVTGTTTITGWATASTGLGRTAWYETATPHTNSSALKCPGGANFTSAKGDVLRWRSFGAGNWAVEHTQLASGAPVVSGTAGKHKLWIPAVAMRPQTASGPAAADVGASEVQYYTLDFDQTTAEVAHFNISMPSSWNEGTITFVPIWTAAAGTGDVLWRLQALARSNDDAITDTYTNSVTSLDTLIATGDLHRGPESSALTVDDTPAANDMVFFRFIRVAADGSDTLTADARLIGIEIYITTDAAVDVA